MSYSLRSFLLFFTFSAAVLLLILSQVSLRKLNQKLISDREAFGILVSGVNCSWYEVIFLGDTLQTDDSTELAGAHLFRVSDPAIHSLELTLFDGNTLATTSKTIPFVTPQMALTLTTVHSELDGLASDRTFCIQRTDSKWMGERVGQFSVPYESHFTFSFKIESGETHDGSVLAFAFFSKHRPNFKQAMIDQRSIKELKDLAQEQSIKIVFCRIVAR